MKVRIERVGLVAAMTPPPRRPDRPRVVGTRIEAWCFFFSGSPLDQRSGR